MRPGGGTSEQTTMKARTPVPTSNGAVSHKAKPSPSTNGTATRHHRIRLELETPLWQSVSARAAQKHDSLPHYLLNLALADMASAGTGATTEPNAEGASNTRPIAGLKAEFVCDSNTWSPKIPDSLFVDTEDRLYLGFADERDVDGNQVAGLFDAEGRWKPLTAATSDDVRRVTPKEALEWYARVTPFTDSTTGDLVNLCRIAAQAMQNCPRPTRDHK
jgi:hypothetical protein